MLQVGAALSGWCEAETADAVPAPLAGQLAQTRARWSYAAIDPGGRPVQVTYQATLISPLAMTGTLSTPASPQPVTAARK